MTKNWLGNVFRFGIMLLAMFFVGGCIFVTEKRSQQAEEARTKYTEEAIEEDNTLKELDSVCKRIPPFEDYKLSSRAFGKHKKFTTHFYTSLTIKSKVDFSKLKDFYTNYLKENGWKLINDCDFINKEIEFEKDGKNVKVSTGPQMTDGTVYAVECISTIDTGADLDS